MRNRVHQEIFFITCLLLAFFLPVFPKILPGIIFLMGMNWIISGVYLETIPRMLNEKWRLYTISFALLYLLYLVGMLYTTDYEYGWFDLEVKMSLFVFPMIFATSDPGIFSPSRKRFIFSFFIAGSLAGSIILLGHAWYNHKSGLADAFYYTNLAWYFHSSYLAMYFTFGTGILLYTLIDDLKYGSVKKIIIRSLILLYLEVIIFLLSSKAGLVALVITQMMFVLLLILRKTGLTRIILIATVLAVVFAGFLKIFPFAYNRISRADSALVSSGTLKTNPEDGTIARMEIWKISFGLIGKHLMFGVGTGDVKNVYLQAYEQKNLDSVLKKKLNAHNQYLQTFVTLGFLGFSLLILLLIVPAYGAVRNGNYLYFLFLLIFAVHILFESMLETQAGVIFYSFFNVFLFSVEKDT
jgi:O-antigen ligase